MIVRQMRLEDIASVYDLGRNAEEFKVDETTDGFWPISILENLVNSKNDIMLVAEDEKNLVGFIIVTNHIPTKKSTVENLYLIPDYRRKTLASELYIEAEKKIRDLGMQYICAFIEEGNKKCLSTTQKNGFVQSKKYYWLLKEINEK